MVAWDERGGRGPSRVRVALRLPGAAFSRAQTIGQGNVQAISVGAQGDAVIAWTQWRGTAADRWDVNVAIRNRDAKTFRAALRVPQTGARPNASATIDSHGRATVSWIASGALLTATAPPGGMFGPARVITPGDGASSVSAITTDGNTVWAITATNGPLSVLQATDDETDLAGRVELESPFAVLPQLAADGHGNVVAVWQALDRPPRRHAGVWPPYGMIMTATRDAITGRWNAPTRVSGPGQKDSRLASLSVSANGDAAIAWEQGRKVDFSHVSDTRVELAVRRAGGAYGHTQTQSRTNEIAREPTVALLSSGETLTAWRSSLPGNRHIVARARQPDGSLGPTQVMSDFRWSATSPLLASTGHEVVLAWHELTRRQSRVVVRVGST
jgi:hypothetical protein